MIEFIQAVLVDWGKQFWQNQGEALAAWLLRLWGTGVGLAHVGVWQVVEVHVGEVEGRNVRRHFAKAVL